MDFKAGDTIKCGNYKEWMQMVNTLKKEGYEVDFKPGMVICIEGKKEEM